LRRPLHIFGAQSIHMDTLVAIMKDGTVVFHRVLDHVFSTWSHVAVLRALRDTAHPLTGREVARTAGMNHRSCLRALTALEDLHLITRQRGGRDHLFALNRDHVLVKQALLPLLENERKFLGEVIGFVRPKLALVTKSVILFGSVVRKEETVRSDLDVCLVVQNDQGKKRAQEVLHGITPECQRRYGARLAPLLFTVTEFRRNNKLKKSPVPEIVHEGEVITGSSIGKLLRA
jgi:predicted nucleotidyltransferase/DNA-binding transcriptional ArsR family regulator